MSETMTKHVPGSAEDVLAAIESLAPEVSARAAETEAARRLPADLVALLASSGCFGMLLPRSHGGVEGTLADQLHAVEVLARADASVGWTVMIGSSAWFDMVHLPRATFDELFVEPGTIVAGAISPSGSAEATGSDRFRVTGRWGFITGVEHATWVGLNCLYDRPGGWPAKHAARRRPPGAGRGRGHLEGQRAARHRQPARPGRGRRGAGHADLRPVGGRGLRRPHRRAGACTRVGGPVRLPGRAGYRRRRAGRHPRDRR